MSVLQFTKPEAPLASVKDSEGNTICTTPQDYFIVAINNAALIAHNHRGDLRIADMIVEYGQHVVADMKRQAENTNAKV